MVSLTASLPRVTLLPFSGFRVPFPNSSKAGLLPWWGTPGPLTHRFPASSLLLPLSGQFPLLVQHGLGLGALGLGGGGGGSCCSHCSRLLLLLLLLLLSLLLLLLLAPACLLVGSPGLFQCILILTSPEQSRAPGQPGAWGAPGAPTHRALAHLMRSCRSRSFSFSASSACAFRAFSRSSFSRAARRNCSKLSLDDLAVEDGVVGCFCTRLAQEPMFLILRSCEAERPPGG